jgi:hypothetical protein
MKQENKRNTAKEKEKERKRFPYKSRINENKYKIVDNEKKSYGEFRTKIIATKTKKQLNKDLIRDDLMLELIK